MITYSSILYRIKPIDGGETLKLKPLVDGTFLYIGENKKYVLSILERKAYQIHYETNITPYDFIQLSDERLFTHEFGGYCIYEKDSDGKFQKKLKSNCLL